MKKIIVLSAMVFLIFAINFKLFLNAQPAETVNHHLTLNGYFVLDTQTAHADTARLIPQGAIRGVGDVHALVYEYTVLIKEDAQLDAGFNRVILNGLDDKMAHNLNILNIDTTLVDSETTDQIDILKQTFIVTITLNQPSTERELALYRTITNIEYDVNLFLKE